MSVLPPPLAFAPDTTSKAPQSDDEAWTLVTEMIISGEEWPLVAAVAPAAEPAELLDSEGFMTIPALYWVGSHGGKCVESNYGPVCAVCRPNYVWVAGKQTYMK